MSFTPGLRLGGGYKRPPYSGEICVGRSPGMFVPSANWVTTQPRPIANPPVSVPRRPQAQHQRRPSIADTSDARSSYKHTSKTSLMGLFRGRLNPLSSTVTLPARAMLCQRVGRNRNRTASPNTTQLTARVARDLSTEGSLPGSLARRSAGPPPLLA